MVIHVIYYIQATLLCVFCMSAVISATDKQLLLTTPALHVVATNAHCCACAHVLVPADMGL